MVLQQLLGPNGLVYSSKDENGTVGVYWGGRLFYSFRETDIVAKKLGVALLGQIGVVRKSISEVFGVSLNTVTNICDVYQREGAAGLNDYRQGRPRISEELKGFVIQSYVEWHEQRGYQRRILEAVQEKVREGLFVRGISRTQLHVIIREHKEQVRRQQEQRQQQRQRRTASKQQCEQDSAARQQERERNEREQPELAEVPDEDQRCVQHGGAAAVIPFMHELGLKQLLGDQTREQAQRYGASELAIVYGALNAAGIVEVEQDFKLLGSYQMGGIIGRMRLPSLALYRERIPQIVGRLDMDEVMLETSKQAHRIFGFSEVLYVDGHFLPYYGKNPILYGYNSQRRLAMHGREYFFVHDQDGLPVYATISDGYRKMQHYLEAVDAKLRKIYGVGKRHLLEVFDRGGYSQEFCVQIAETIRFICWRSDARVVPRIEAAAWVEVEVALQANEYGESQSKKLHAWERAAEFEVNGKKAKFRELWIRDGRKTSPALTNDFQLSLPQVVAALARRWGAQENAMKTLKDHGIDRIHSYRSEPYSEEFLYDSGLEKSTDGVRHEINNPKVRRLTKEISQLRSQERRLLARLTKLRSDQKPQLAKALKNKIRRIQAKIQRRVKQRQGLPKKVRMMDRIQQDNIVRLCEQKKLFFDWLKMTGIWAKKKLAQVARPFYRDLRDLSKFVTSVLSSRTYVTRHRDTLYVSFPPQRSQNAASALQALCDYLNQTPTMDLDLTFTSIRFRVGQKH